MRKFFLFTLILLFFSKSLAADIIYTEPVNNAEYVSIKNNIIIGFDEIIVGQNVNSKLKVTGTKSGIHTGDIIFSKDSKKIIFIPHRNFEYNETVQVVLNNLKTSHTSGNNIKYSFQTQIRKIDINETLFLDEEYERSFSNSIFSSMSDSTVPPLTVAISNNPSPGKLFLNSYANNNYTVPYLVIANNDGSVYHSKAVTASSPDFKRQPNGLLTYFHRTPRLYYAEDQQYNIIDSFYCGNGYITNSHDMLLFNNGHALVMSYDPQPVDMSVIVTGGQPDAIVTGLIIQEIDENKNVVFQWRSWDHFQITDAVYIDLTLSNIDYCHGNAFELDNDGNIMISSRHMNEITKISRSTGEIIWRMGGENNEFTFVNDTLPFHYQHDIRRIANGNITLYDNGNLRYPQFSRAVEYHLDEENKIATLVWQYRNSPDIFSPSRGSAQRLKNGNTLIGWGGMNPTLTEVTPSGEIALQMTFPQGIYSYRAFRDEVHMTLNTKLAIEGFYDPQTNLLRIKDTVISYLRETNSPFALIDSSKTVVDSVLMNANFRFYNVIPGSYYNIIKHRNALETWSKYGIDLDSLGRVQGYDFTDSITKAYGDNLVLKGSLYCIYSGDVDHDGIIDLSDINLIYNEAASFITGYTDTDINGDYISDLTDILITYYNSSNFVSVIKP